ncbi:tuzin [Angomonas deanei]|uniref:Uncharacterized protein n=1 Tax=Angomonas deanei TaxID=59799 RepID=A0A7G2C7B3_9TRYP|nr:tuzin [Angomonas deanei]CAD2215710.1 hypothetical protein, conserved [Angomonas deanei]|eukprot:EPY26083.1 tuzin [Angomonas deanei]
MANTSLPRLDFYTVPLFTPRQAFDYTQHTVDPLSLQHFIEVVGTNSNDLDELFAAVNQRSTAPTNYINHKLVRAMRHLQSVCANSPASRTALHRLASFPFESGQHSGVDSAALRHPRLKDIVLYDPVRDAWLFRSKVLHTATLSCWGVGRKGE